MVLELGALHQRCPAMLLEGLGVGEWDMGLGWASLWLRDEKIRPATDSVGALVAGLPLDVACCWLVAACSSLLSKEQV